MADDAHGHFHWNELMTNDVDAAKAFYTSIMGWSFDEMPMPEGTYYVAIADDEPVCGLMAMPAEAPPGMPPHWLGYIEVRDIDGQVEKAKSAGAVVLKEPFTVPEVGRIAIIQDPTGAAIGWITPSVEE